MTGHHVVANARAARRRGQCPKAARNARSKRSGRALTAPSTALGWTRDGRAAGRCSARSPVRALGGSQERVVDVGQIRAQIEALI